MDPLLDLLAGRDESLDLDRAALEIARIEYPGLDFQPSLAILDSHANELARRLGQFSGGAEYVRIAGQYLFGELGFRGNSRNYYDPRNSCLNNVLTERTGIPITLSVVYMEIARRLGRPVVGIGLPGHFVAAYRDTAYSTFVDVFNGGQLLAPEPDDARWLALAGKRQIVVRMLHNLRGVYLLPAKAVVCESRADPRSAAGGAPPGRGPPGDARSTPRAAALSGCAELSLWRLARHMVLDWEAGSEVFRDPQFTAQDVSGRIPAANALLRIAVFEAAGARQFLHGDGHAKGDVFLQTAGGAEFVDATGRAFCRPLAQRVRRPQPEPYPGAGSALFLGRIGTHRPDPCRRVRVDPRGK